MNRIICAKAKEYSSIIRAGATIRLPDVVSMEGVAQRMQLHFRLGAVKPAPGQIFIAKPAEHTMTFPRTLLGFLATISVALYANASLATHEEKGIHHLVIQVTENDAAAMSLALSNAVNVAQHYSEAGEEVEIEIVAYGPGLHMLRADTSPVKDKVKSMAESLTSVVFTACGNTMTTMERTEGKPVLLVPQAKIIKTGVARIMELQELGWIYVRP